MNWEAFEFSETIGAGKTSRVNLREYFALVSGSGLQLRLKGQGGTINLPLNFVFGDGMAPLGDAEVVNPTGSPVAFRLLTSSVGFNASALSNTQSTAITSCSVTLPISGTVSGVDADGAARSVNPIGTAGYDGAAMRAIKVDTTGRQLVAGAAAAGAAVAGNPVLIGGSDGTNAQALKVDAAGRQVVAGAAAAGAAVAGNPVLAGGTDGTNAQALKVDTGGRQVVVGAAAPTTAVVGNPVLVGGVDGGGNVETFSTTGQGNLRIALEATTGSIGQTASRTRAAAGTNATLVKNSTARLFSVVVSNTSAAVRFLKLYNKASAPTVGTDTPVMVILVPAGQTVSLAYGGLGIAFATGLGFGMTTGEADSDVGALTAGDLHVTIGYI